MHKPLIISVVGAGGKTTHIHRLAEKYLKQGKKVLVITTTHMYLEKDTILELENDMETSVLWRRASAWREVRVKRKERWDRYQIM